MIERNQRVDGLKHRLFESAVYIGAAITAALFYKSKDKEDLVVTSFYLYLNQINFISYLWKVQSIMSIQRRSHVTGI
jgi:hypothetical protein